MLFSSLQSLVIFSWLDKYPLVLVHRATWRSMQSQSHTFSLNKIFILSQKVFHIFREIKLSSAKIRKVLILCSLSFQNVSTKKFLLFSPEEICFEEVSYIFSKKKLFLVFRKRNPIFRTIAYLELKAYSEPWNISSPTHIQNTFKHLRWDCLQNKLPNAPFDLGAQNFVPQETALYFGKQNIFIFAEMKVCSLIFQEVTFPVEK